MRACNTLVHDVLADHAKIVGEYVYLRAEDSQHERSERQVTIVALRGEALVDARVAWTA